MRFSVFSTTLTIALATARPQYGEISIDAWHPAGADDFRGPCPMMNTLANHGFLPRDGRNLTKANVVKGLGDGINFDPTLAGIMWDQAIIASPEPNATFFTLDDLNRHNVLEHDASMSRSDAFFGNNHVFNKTIFETTTVYWTASTLDAKQLANGKIFRQVESRASNPEYTFTASTENFSVGEVAAPIIVFGDMEAGTVQKDLVVYFFENERLPTELGWTKKADAVTLDNIMAVSSIIANATSLITGASAENSKTKKRNLHAGMRF